MNASTLAVLGQVSFGGADFDGELRVAEHAGDAVVNFDTFKAAGSSSTSLNLRRSNSDTLGNKTETDDNEDLGEIAFKGIDTGSNWDTGAVIRARQDGAAGTRVPTELWLYTYSDSTTNHPQLVLKPDGAVGIGFLVPSYTLSIGSADKTDQVGIYHDNTDAYMKWDDGDLYLQTDEGTNTSTTVYVRGKGSGVGVLDADGEVYSDLRFYAALGFGHRDDTDTEIFFPSDDQINFLVGSIEMMRMVEDGSQDMVVINELGADVDFRVEGTGVANALFVQGSDGFVGVGSGAPLDRFQVQGASAGAGAGTTAIRIGQGAISVGAITRLISGVVGGGSPYFAIEVRQGANPFATLERVRIDPNGNFGINTTSPDGTLHVEGDCFFGDKEGNGDYIEFENDADVVFVGGAGMQCGEIWYHGAGSDLVMAAQDTWYQVASFDTDGDSNGSVTPAHGSDHITVGKTGIYRVSFGASLRSAASNKYELSVFTNNGATEFVNSHAHRDTTVAAKLGDVSRSILCRFLANDTVELWAQRLDGGAVAKTLTFEQVVLNVEQIGGEEPPP